MKKHVLPKLLIASALAVTIGTTFALSSFQQKDEPVIQTLAGEGNYYSGISDDLTGTDLLNALHTLNSNKRKKTIGYDGLKTTLKLTERAASTPSDKMVGFYDNALVSASWDNQATWNREHIWPNSRGGGSKNKGGLSSPYVDADIHMTRPASVSINSARGNLMFGTIAGTTYDPGQYVAEYRGVAARIIFYCAIADTRLSLTENESDASSNSTMGKLSDLLRWNLQYAPTTDTNANLALQVEQNRNEVIYSNSSLQGNRNPFIDHPEYACKIWGNTNESTRRICGLSSDAPTAITLNDTEQTINVGETYQLRVASVTPENANNTVTWASSSNSIATVSTSGLVTGVKAGTVTITASSKINTFIKATCTITVVQNGGGDDSSETSETPPTSESEPSKPDNKKKGCHASLSMMSIFIPVLSGVVLVTLVIVRKKRKEE